MIKTKFALVTLLIVVSHIIASVSADEIKLTHNKLTLNANLVMAQDKTMEDGVVLMTHGTLAHSGMEIIQTLQTLLKERGYNSLAITLGLGLDDRHGFYDCATPHDHQHTDALDEIGVWLNWLKEKGANKIILLGHSRGGNQTAWFATERDEPAIQGVVLIAPAVWSEESDSGNYQKRYNKELKSIFNKATDLAAQGKGNSWLEHTDFIYCKDTKVTARSFISYYKPDARRNTPYLLPKISKPTLVFAGSEDTTVKGVDKKVAPLADGKKIKLVVIDGADHFFRDLYAEDIADVFDEFFGGL